jgi:ABC-type multidrug transport system fused ATPase/permease subunit
MTEIAVRDLPPVFTLLQRLWRHISLRRRAQLAVLFVLMVVATLSEIAAIGAVLPFLAVLSSPQSVFVNAHLQPLIAFLGISESTQLLAPLTVIFIAAALLSGGLRLLLLYVQTRLSHAIGADVSTDIYRRTLYQPYAVHISRNSSEVISAMLNKAHAIVGHAVIPCLTISSSLLMLAAILITLFAIDPIIASSSFAGFGLIYVAVIFFTRRRLAIDSARINHEQNETLKIIQEGLGGIRDVLIDGTQNIYCKAYRNADVPLRRAVANIQIIGATPRYCIEAMGMALIAGLAYSLASRAGGLGSAIPVLGALALGAQRLLPVLQQGYAAWTMIKGGQVSLNDALNLLDQPLPEYASLPPPVPMSFQRGIELRNLSFRYSADGPWVLRDLNLSIPKGARVGFIGTTGSGKSTLSDVVMGLLEAEEGFLAIDGVPLSAQNRRAWQSRIAHVPQSIFLADVRIAENIAFGVPPDAIDLDRVRRAAKQARIAETIEGWAEGYDTLAGERGIRLSGGQRQRIGIARALYKQADVIVLDEATSALDNDTEKAVMHSLENLGDRPTMLIVAHRLTTLRNCSHIVELNNGQVVRIGNFNDIIGQVA